MNRNTKAMRVQLRAAGKAGRSSIAVQVPDGDYHNHEEPHLHLRSIPTAIRQSDGVISQNAKRNTVMVALHNTDDVGRTTSVTMHGPAARGAWMKHKNHDYVKGYRQANEVVKAE